MWLCSSLNAMLTTKTGPIQLYHTVCSECWFLVCCEVRKEVHQKLVYRRSWLQPRIQGGGGEVYPPMYKKKNTNKTTHLSLMIGGGRHYFPACQVNMPFSVLIILMSCFLLYIFLFGRSTLLSCNPGCLET